MQRPIFKPVGTHVEDLDTPALVVDLDALGRNIEVMHSSFRDGAVKLRPKRRVSPLPRHRAHAARSRGHGRRRQHLHRRTGRGVRCRRNYRPSRSLYGGHGAEDRAPLRARAPRQGLRGRRQRRQRARPLGGRVRRWCHTQRPGRHRLWTRLVRRPAGQGRRGPGVASRPDLRPSPGRSNGPRR